MPSGPLPAPDAAFSAHSTGLHHAVDLLVDPPRKALPPLPDLLPQTGVGERAALDTLAPKVLGGAAALGAPMAFAHMDPPTPWVAWATTLWNAALNQNLLHPDTAPVAASIEKRVVAWLAPLFGMAGGHMLPGSTLANLTALWAAREVAGVRTVAASGAAHLSVRKAAHLLGLSFRELPAGRDGAILPSCVGALDDATALVLTAGHTATGAIDPLSLAGRAAWTHVDAAWAGPLRLSVRHAALLDGIEAADSVAVSAHKWLFQPKESALVLFSDPDRVEPAISTDAPYLARANIGLLGSHGATAVPLLATLLALGRAGIAERIDRCMAAAATLAAWVDARADCELLAPMITGVVTWRPKRVAAAELLATMPIGSISKFMHGGEEWVRNVAANPNASIWDLISQLNATLASLQIVAGSGHARSVPLR